jgi:hypothetical protein
VLLLPVLLLLLPSDCHLLSTAGAQLYLGSFCALVQLPYPRQISAAAAAAVAVLLQ